MTIELLATGVLVGFLVAAPVGPVAALCIQRTVFDGRLAGYATGIGAALGDLVFGALALFSVALVDSLLDRHRALVQGLGGAVLIALGARTMLARRASRTVPAAEDEIDHLSLLQSLASAFAVTLFNPVTVLAFLSIFAALRLQATVDGLTDSWTVLAGVFAGALAWWLLLSTLAAALRRDIGERGLRLLHLATGAAIGCFGVYALAALAWTAA